MRYELRFANGYWRLFDTVEYTTVRLFWTRVDAQECVDFANDPD